jgi:cytochrome c biogenesis protein CcmG/thiol:disulfide interchange protein DsbE
VETVETRTNRPLWPVAVPLAVFGGVVGFLGFMLLQDDRDPSYLPSPLIGKAAPSVAGPSLIADSPAVTNDLIGAGGPVLVNFFASWCLPCRVEHEVLSDLAGDAGLTVIGINYKDEPEDGRAFLGELGNPYAAVVGDGTGAISVNWGVTGLPETFVVDGDGIIVYRHFGPILPEQRDDLLQVVEDAS